jgi:hypothetical protein
MKTTLKICLIFLATTASAQSSRVPIIDLKPAMASAAANGEIAGVFSGELAEFYAREFHSSAPVLVDITRTGPHREPGCARLRVRISQAGVRRNDAAGKLGNPVDQALAFTVNYCANGRYPVGEDKP